jgi:replicative DNA helicase
LDRGQLNVFDDAEDVLKEDFRHPVPMGIKGIDNALKGGLAKGEIGVILAPTGVGKSTILTKISNHAYNLGFNVLQVFFEDNPKIIQRKHFTLWTKIKPDNLTDEKEAVLSQIQELKKMENKLILKKLPSETLTMSAIKNQVRKIISEGIKIDLICLDYIDCVLPDRHSGDEWKGEGSVIRAFEAMCHELDIVGWTATQGNRSSISSDVVTNDQMGGSIKKAQVGHVIISIAKSMEQKEAKLATLAITKSRIGTDGIIFKNCKFDNEMLEIDTESSVTLLGHHEEVEQAVELASKKRLAELNSAKVSRVN